MSAPDAVRLAEGCVSALLGIVANARRDIVLAREDERVAKESERLITELAHLCEKVRAVAPWLPLTDVERGLRGAAAESSAVLARTKNLRELAEARLVRDEEALAEARGHLVGARAPQVPAEPELSPAPPIDAAALLQRAAEGASRLGVDYTAPQVADLLFALANEIRTGEPVPRPA